MINLVNLLTTTAVESTTNDFSLFEMLKDIFEYTIWYIPYFSYVLAAIYYIAIPIIISAKVKNVPLKCTLLLIFNKYFAAYYIIKAVTEKDD